MVSDYTELFDKIPDGITIHDPSDGSIITANSQFCEMLGYDREELPELDFETLHVNEPPYTNERAREYIQKASSEGPQHFEWLDKTKAGEPLPVEVHLRETELDGDERILAVVRDISERRAREQELERVRERMEFALDVTNSVIWSLDLDADESVEYGPVKDLFGQEPTGMEDFIDAVVHPHDKDDVGAVYEAVITGETDEFDVEFRTKLETGEERWIASRGYVHDATDGEPRRLVGLSTDITERKRNELELTEQNHRLDEFAKIVSHDLRNPLNVAVSRLTLAQEECDSEHHTSIQNALDRMDTLIDDLLVLAKEGEQIAETETVELSSLVKECWENVQTNGASVDIRAERSLRADRSRLKQLLENLVRNAIEHGGPDVTVQIGDLEDGFYVADDGPGIPESERDVVFEPGYSNSEGGTGVGLSIVKQVVEAHGWHIEAGTSDDGGARFEITGLEGPASKS